MQQASRATSATASRRDLRSIMRRSNARSTQFARLPTPPGRGEPTKGAHQGAAQVRARRDGDVPARHSLQSALPGLLEPDLEGDAQQDCGADCASSATFALQQRDADDHDRRVQHAGQAAIVREGRLQQQAQVRQRPSGEPGQAVETIAMRAPAQCRHQHRARDVGPAVARAPVHPGGAPAAPRLRQCEAGLPVELLRLQPCREQGAGGEQCSDRPPPMPCTAR